MKKVPKNAPAGVYEKDKKKPADKKKDTSFQKLQATEESLDDNESDRKDSQDFNQI